MGGRVGDEEGFSDLVGDKVVVGLLRKGALVGLGDSREGISLVLE